MMSIIRKPVKKNIIYYTYIVSSQKINVANLQTFGGLLRQANGSVMKAPLSRLSFTPIQQFQSEVEWHNCSIFVELFQRNGNKNFDKLPYLKIIIKCYHMAQNVISII